MLFEEVDLKLGLKKSIEEVWYTELTPIQEEVIPMALDWKNIVGQAQTGTGKTAAFLLPILNNIDTNSKTVQCLILAPTRELVVQISEEIHSLTKYYRVPVITLFWWVSSMNQKRNLKKGPRIIVATPWRFMDLLWQGLINLSTVNTFVLDEVDRMLDMWFIKDIVKIWKQLSHLKQTLTFSATMNDKMKRVIDNFTPDYEFIKVGDEITVDKIDHSYMTVELKDKIINLTKLVSTNKNEKIIVFVNTKIVTNLLYEILLKENFKAGKLNWDIRQSKRISTLKWFTKDKFNVLVTTDVAARWLNMDGIWLVINFDIPVEPESYVHRIWRTWRAGASGKAVMFVWKGEKRALQDVEKVCGAKIKLSDYKWIVDEDGIYDHLLNSTWRFKRPAKKNPNDGRFSNNRGSGWRWKRTNGRRKKGKRAGRR